jgi:hypothetical protein
MTYKLNEQAHREKVRWLIDDISDIESRADIKKVTRKYETVRTHLIAAAVALRELDALNDFDYSDELCMDISSMLRDLRSDEIAVLEMTASMHSTYAEESIVHNGGDEFANKNDETVSGIDDITLMCQLDGKVH